MTRFYFQVFNGFCEEDAVVCDLDNPGDLRREAVTYASASLFDRTGVLCIPADWHLDAYDGGGELLFRLSYPNDIRVSWGK